MVVNLNLSLRLTIIRFKKKMRLKLETFIQVSTFTAKPLKRYELGGKWRT